MFELVHYWEKLIAMPPIWDVKCSASPGHQGSILEKLDPIGGILKYLLTQINLLVNFRVQPS